jgi:hypothetical protein
MPRGLGVCGSRRKIPSQAPRTVPGVFTTAVIHILCEARPSLGTAVVNGLIAWAGVLGGCTVFFSGLPAAVALFIPSRPDSLARRINQGLGIGFLAGMAGGLLLFFVVVAKVAS